ncbi:Protein of unknown function (DUF4237) [Streptoalloteichus tenebrarius]|uniref:TNT domain-containing protein n=3 Tax=Streptoalloteichus tenebrarius (strain ATCC 17920 / DSM 40477 / JCM 4838 / CBS 697.72 / NBRC 16177 / NCIMB 11028 / NRRL B-12390 / A12253. 1 / ISP 5477) TaxID=1933 RepID=A0ABT1HSX7_STRSD|nr:Protein of unknown function (DUF4237) [Streptoalloteichus tenebrarius]
MAFYLHMFPIGHMPKVATRPERQLRAPASERNFASGLRFPPQDHPMSGMVEDAEALRRVRAGERPPPAPAAAPAHHPEVEALAEDHEPLGDVAERDWQRRFLVRPADPAAGRRAEYNWPPSEMFPEGCLEPAEPWVLDEGTVLDRFGDPEGRVLAEAGTPFRFRCLPPEHLRRGYRRYRVLRSLPVWRATTAPWFGQPGGGDRYRATYPVVELVALGYLEEIELVPPAPEPAPAGDVGLSGDGAVVARDGAAPAGAADDGSGPRDRDRDRVDGAEPPTRGRGGETEAQA